MRLVHRYLMIRLTARAPAVKCENSAPPPQSTIPPPDGLRSVDCDVAGHRFGKAHTPQIFMNAAFFRWK